MGTKVILLGTGTPNPEPDRSGPSVVIMVDEEVYIVDFGPGIVRRAIEAGLTSAHLKRAYLTHLHSDHTVGYPDLIFTPAVTDRNAPLEVYGPTGIEAMTNHILEAYKEDIRERTTGLEPANQNSYIVRVHEIQSNFTGTIYSDDLVSVEAFPVDHGNLSCFGFKFKTPDKIIVVSGDTAPSDTLVEMARGCDILIHEVYSAKALQLRPTEWKRYHSSVHTSSYEVAEIASKVRPKLLVLYHQLSWTSTDEELVNEIRERYDGEVVSGNDLDVF
ncbi:MAG: MBL fold metallo-hydrolase [Candidatus Thorarchaeota archaeon]|nr:MBL fold metallo-hydrolase [Candidatus Thorarchaeota archaeon]